MNHTSSNTADIKWNELIFYKPLTWKVLMWMYRAGIVCSMAARKK